IGDDMIAATLGEFGGDNWQAAVCILQHLQPPFADVTEVGSESIRSQSNVRVDEIWNETIKGDFSMADQVLPTSQVSEIHTTECVKPRIRKSVDQCRDRRSI